MRVWRSEPGRASFDLRAAKKLTQHTGPVSSVALSGNNIFSGSWDYSVRVWCRATLQQLALLSFPDWVDCLAPRYVTPAVPRRLTTLSFRYHSGVLWLTCLLSAVGVHTCWWLLGLRCTCTAWPRRSGCASWSAPRTRWTCRRACASRAAATRACCSQVGQQLINFDR